MSFSLGCFFLREGTEAGEKWQANLLQGEPEHIRKSVGAWD